ncbi:MAG: hypothetical protein ACTSQF_09140 [Candidatus Heimdallarchaeaceae archaeon]
MAFFDDINNIMYVVLGIIGFIIIILIIMATKGTFSDLKLKKKAKSLGFRTIKEMRIRQSEGFESQPEYDNIMSLGFTDRQEFLFSEKFGTRTQEEMYKKLNQTVKDLLDLMEDYKFDLTNLADEIILILSLDKMAEISEEFTQKQTTFNELREEVNSYPKEKVLDQSKINIPKEIKDLQNETAAKLYSVKSTLDVRMEYVTERTSIVELLNQFRPNVPVNLNRVGEISKLSLKDVESFLKDIVEANPDIGEYLELEQVFIRKTDTEIQIDELLNQFQKWEVEGEGKKK